MTRRRKAREPVGVTRSPGGGPVEMTREQAMVLAAEALLVEASLARRDPKRFFSFCMREERTQSPVHCLPHQRVVFDFVMAHPRCVLRMPVGTSKTFSMAALTLFFLGQDNTNRGAIVSSAQGQAAKPLKMVSDYITEPQLATTLRLVFPHLRASPRTRDPWTQTAITVDRPPGIRDPSLVAIGIDGQLPGARLSWCIVDDILDRENTSTVGGRQKVFDFFDSTILARLDHDNPDARLVVTNTPWHPEDLTYRLEREAGWPTLTMDVMGNITLSNVPHDWDTDDIVPSKRPGDAYRLAAHQPDPEEQLPLWPQRYSAEVIESLRKSHLPHRFNQLYLCQCRDDEHARCKLEWIEKCKAHGRGKSLVSEYNGQNLTVTGVDLAVGQGEEHDYTAFVTLELLPSGKRRILDVDVGRYDGPTTVAKVLRIAKRYKSIVRVENNASQDYILQFARASNASVPIKPHTTGRNKAHPEYGVEGIFVEIQNGGWVIPCDMQGRCHKNVQTLIDQCRYYEPGKHTGDALMAMWLAREQARELGDGRLLTAGQQTGGQFSNFLSR